MKKGFLQKKNVEKKKEKQQSVVNKESAMNKEDKCGPDRISSLPEGIIHHILSFLDMKQVVQTSVLSRRWRKTWVSLPTLNITDQSWLDENNNLRNDKFVDFVNKVLLLRDGSDIQKFHLTCPNYDSSTNRIHAWVVSIIRRNVQSLHLEEMYVPPVSSFCLSTTLKTLELVNVLLSTEMEGSWCGPVLENLVVENCFHDHLERLTISSPKLKYLMLESEIGFVDSGPSSCEIKICAPNLKFFGCIGYIYKDYCFEDLSSLVTAQIDTELLCCNKMHEMLGTCFNNLLRGLVNAKSLTLSLKGIQRFSVLPTMFKPGPISFPNLKYLKLKEWRSYCNNHGLAKLFESFSCIETLVLERAEVNSPDEQVRAGLADGTEELYGLTKMDWDMPNCKFCKLKSVDLQNLTGGETELVFIKFLLKTAIVLENITIASAKGLSKRREILWAEFSKKIQSLPRASPSATISCLQNTGT